MRCAAIFAAVLVAAGCGSSKAERAPGAKARGDSYTVVLEPAGQNGRWVKLFLSLDGRTWLAQWSGECEAQTAYFVPAHGGKPRPVTSAADESIALGWAPRNRARILVPHAGCGGQFRRPGVYLVDRQGHAAFVKAVKARPGGP